MSNLTEDEFVLQLRNFIAKACASAVQSYFNVLFHRLDALAHCVKEIAVKVEDLPAILATVKANLGAVSVTLETVAATQTKATAEILAKLAALADFVLPDDVAALLGDIADETDKIVTATGTVSGQAKALDDIVPDAPVPTPAPTPTPGV